MCSSDLRGLRVVGVTFNDARGAARRFVRDERATWRMGFDADGVAARAFCDEGFMVGMQLETSNSLAQIYFRTF